MKKLFIILLIFLGSLSCVAQEDINNNAVHFIPYEKIKNIVQVNNSVNYDIKQAHNATRSINGYVIASERFAQSNISSAYNEFEKLTYSANNDFLRIILAYELSKIGFFSLAKDNLDKIVNQYTFREQIDFVKKNYFPEKVLSKDEELKLAEYYTDIYFNNLPFETVKVLNKDDDILKKSDYVYYVLSQAYLETKEISKALNAINKAISLNKDNVIYKKYKAQILCEDKKYNDALKIIDDLIKETSSQIVFSDEISILNNYILAQAENDNAKSKYYLAKYLFQINDFQRALKEANASVFVKKKNIDAYNLIGDIYLKENNLFKASDSYKKAYKFGKKNPQTLLNLANIEFYWDDYDKALEMYNSVLKRQKNNEDAMLNIATCYVLKNDIKNANLWIKKVLNVNPRNYKVFYLLSYVDSGSSVEHLKKSISINPLYVDAWGNLARIYLEKGDIKTGKEYLFPLEYLAYKNYLYYYCLGLIYQSQNDDMQARKAFEKSLVLYADYKPAKDALIKIDKKFSENVINEEI